MDKKRKLKNLCEWEQLPSNWKHLMENDQDVIPGGLADKHSPESLAAYHEVNIDVINDQIEKGSKVEMEHTDDPAKAKEIAMDHLAENPKYYDDLATIEPEHSVVQQTATNDKTEVNEDLFGTKFGPKPEGEEKAALEEIYQSLRGVDAGTHKAREMASRIALFVVQNPDIATEEAFQNILSAIDPNNGTNMKIAASEDPELAMTESILNELADKKEKVLSKRTWEKAKRGGVEKEFKIYNKMANGQDVSDVEKKLLSKNSKRMKSAVPDVEFDLGGGKTKNVKFGTSMKIYGERYDFNPLKSLGVFDITAVRDISASNDVNEAEDEDLGKEREVQDGIRTDIQTIKDQISDVDNSDDTKLDKAKEKQNLTRQLTARIGDLSTSMEKEAELEVKVAQENERKEEDGEEKDTQEEET